MGYQLFARRERFRVLQYIPQELAKIMSSVIGDADQLSSLTSAQACHKFSLAEIQSATNDFDEKFVIGRGGFGKEYKGRICMEETSHVVAIKRLDSMSDQGAAEFRTEIEMLSKLRHRHLVSLIGFSDDSKEMILVYEYMPHGTLHDHLHKADTPLIWTRRLKISIGAGLGLDYLHTGVGIQHGVIHRDVKSSNILLDESWEARISDFGLSKVGPTNQSVSYVDASIVRGTFGYLDPECFYTGRLTRKTDVFAFGVLLFELLSGMLAVDERLVEEECSLVRWGKKCVKDRRLDQMVDPSIRGTISPKCLRRFAKIADSCLYSVPKERPSMTEVVASLEVLLELEEKRDYSSESSGVIGLTWKFHKYLVSTTKPNSDESGISSQKSLDNHINQRSVGSQHGELVARDLKMFTYRELTAATRNFTYYLGVGNFRNKGWVNRITLNPSIVDTGLPIATKTFHCKVHVDLVLEMLKEFSHPNLVELLGYCLRQDVFLGYRSGQNELTLVYEFMPNGNLQDYLDKKVAARTPLLTKVKIAIGIARGIVFLLKTQYDIADPDLREIVGETSQDEITLSQKHDGRMQLRPDISNIHLDTRKILLDEDFTVKLSGYEVFKLKHSGYVTECQDYYDHDFDVDIIDIDFPNWRLRSKCRWPKSTFAGFTLVFTEVLMGVEISDFEELEEIENVLLQRGGKPLCEIVKLCFKICNEVDSEEKMLRIFREYAKNLP